MSEQQDYEDIVMLLKMIGKRRHGTPSAVYAQRNQINTALMAILRMNYNHEHIDSAPLPRDDDRNYPIEDDVEKWLHNFGS